MYIEIQPASSSRSAVLSTYIANMICPASLQIAPSGKDLYELGSQDFQSYRFRHIAEHFSGDSKPDTDELIRRLANSVELKLVAEKSPLLLLSDGKDSMGIALAFHRLGISVSTLTILRREDAELRRYVKEVAEALGHVPYFVEVDEILNNFDSDTLLGLFQCADYPVLDQALLFFIVGIGLFLSRTSSEGKDWLLVDGMGNDEFFGHIPSKQQLYAYRLSLTGLWKLRPPSGPPAWYLRSPAESQGDMSALRAFFRTDSGYDLDRYFRPAFLSISSQTDFVDFRGFCRGASLDRLCMMEKTRLVARYLGTEVVFPWDDDCLSDYVFNLPIEKKFDLTKLTNKILLRECLGERLGWQQAKRGMDIYYDLSMRNLLESCRALDIEDYWIRKIQGQKFIPLNVKKRGALELMNLAAFFRGPGRGVGQLGSFLT